MNYSNVYMISENKWGEGWELWDQESDPLHAACLFHSPQAPLVAELEGTETGRRPHLVTFHMPSVMFTVEFSKSSLDAAGWSLVYAVAYTRSVLGQVLYFLWSSVYL